MEKLMAFIGVKRTSVFVQQKRHFLRFGFRNGKAKHRAGWESTVAMAVEVPEASWGSTRMVVKVVISYEGCLSFPGSSICHLFGWFFSDPFRGESWPPFGWSKDHLEEAGWYCFFCFFVRVLGAAFQSQKGKLLGLFRPSWYDTVDGRNPANQLRLVAYPTFSKVLYITLVQDFFHQQYNSVFFILLMCFFFQLWYFDHIILLFQVFFWYMSDKLWFLFIVWRGVLWFLWFEMSF